MKCPVCKIEVPNGYTKCSNCGFDDLNRIFINIEEAEEWKNTILTKKREMWNVQLTGYHHIDLESHKAKEVLKKYCTDENYIYKVGDLVINTKFAAFSKYFWKDGFQMSETRQVDYKNFRIEYHIKDDTILVYKIGKYYPDIRYDIATISIPNEMVGIEVLTILEFMKSEKTNFKYAFDDSIEWFQVKYNNDLYTMEKYFKGAFIVPFTFYAKYTEFDGISDIPALNNYGMVQVQFLVENEYGNIVTVKDKERNATKFLKIKLIDLISHKTTTRSMSIGNDLFTSHKLYINEQSKSVFIGEPSVYQEFECLDLTTTYQVFDYIKNLFTY